MEISLETILQYLCADPLGKALWEKAVAQAERDQLKAQIDKPAPLTAVEEEAE